MTQPDGPQLSVRAEAQRSVAPDRAVLLGEVSARRPSKAAALAAAASAVHDVLADLADPAGLGAVVAVPGRERVPLTWLVTSTTSYPDYDNGSATGLIVAVASLRLSVRDFARLDEVGAVLAQHETVSVSSVNWEVDADNPAWPGVRSDAITAAIAKGRDYAAALGARLWRLDQVADTGLLAGGAAGGGTSLRAYSLAAGSPAAPSLDPVPQLLLASIEARFTLTPVSLDGPAPTS